MDSSPRAACPLGPAETGPPTGFRPICAASGWLSRPGPGLAAPGERLIALGHGRIGKDR